MARQISYAMLMVLFAVQPALSESARIHVDGLFEDWDTLAPAYADASGDHISGTIDFGRLWIANDETFLHLCFEVGGEINLQGDNRITLFLDTDNDVSTGQSFYGLGAEFGWTFGIKGGFFVLGEDVRDIYHDQVGLVTGPTVTSTRFEVAVERGATPLGDNHLFVGDTVRVLISESITGDFVPDLDDTLLYIFDDAPLPPVQVPTLYKWDQGHLRILTYNALSDGLFRAGRKRSFDRILNALCPDIIGFQEIYNYSGEQVRATVAAMVPCEGGWYGAKVNPDIIAVSKYPIAGTYPIGTNGAFLIDLRPRFESDLLFIVAHTPCCDNDEGRQREVDAMMAFVRDAKVPGAGLDLVENTPIVIVGDMNFVGDRRQVVTLLTGDIVNTGSYGPRFDPDWDGTEFTDLIPMHTNLPLASTWEDDRSSFWPGRLDYIVYSDAVLDMHNNFVLSTREMSADTLAAYGLLAEDTNNASDHLPVVADFTVEPLQVSAAPTSYIAPNPSNEGITAIMFGRRFEGVAKHVIIYDIRGRLVYEEKVVPERMHVVWDGSNLEGRTVGSGVYFAVIRSSSVEETLKIVYLR